LAAALAREKPELPLAQRAPPAQLVSEPRGRQLVQALRVSELQEPPPAESSRARRLELARGAPPELRAALKAPPGVAQARRYQARLASLLRAHLEPQVLPRLVKAQRERESPLAASAQPWQPPLSLPSLFGPRLPQQLPLPPVPRFFCELFPRRLPEWSSSASSFR